MAEAQSRRAEAATALASAEAALRETELAQDAFTADVLNAIREMLMGSVTGYSLSTWMEMRRKINALVDGNLEARSASENS